MILSCPHKFLTSLNNFDLHNHSNCSDGQLAPRDLVALAVQGGCDALALTDHDNTDGLVEAAVAAAAAGLRFVNGVEISVTWRPDTLHTTLHIVGLDIDPEAPSMVQGLASVRAGRHVRAELMAQDLARVGIVGALEGAYRYAEHPDMISRTHFARFLVEIGKARDVGSAFHHYLVQGKPGYVRHDWTSLAEAIRWIRESHGIPVLAHPGRYRLNAVQMNELLDEFQALGGEAVEVVTGSHSADDMRRFAQIARERGLLASRGADFHGPGESDWAPGTLPLLPAELTPVWTRLRAN
ncbi:MAG: 3',5'-nucleoside bisphosphate phosphatase [Burkholderiales bacterium]|nr:3',5'-nucleoside bisphosphate phosphatase [Burkholderiales bacterium]